MNHKVVMTVDQEHEEEMKSTRDLSKAVFDPKFCVILLSYAASRL